ncbi:MAG: RdgB/HAM1 family non-canonical purine NTP pyrophosphatase [bacterium]|nr:RdgB/HAM1 family non-canonical purine NTP pyrophosphatase [bacterium]
MTRIHIASRNPDKLRELRDILGDEGYRPVSLLELDPAGTLDIAETGRSFTENAVLKATAIAERFGELGLGEDSGLSVDALGGAPGIYSARYHTLDAETIRDVYPGYPGGLSLTATDVPADLLNNVRLLAELDGFSDRAARYACAVALATPAGEVLLAAVGTVEGRIGDRPVGDGGFGYDPLFIPEGSELTFARHAPEAKHAVSHRGRALKRLVDFLKEERP